MTFAQIECFLKVAQENSISKAAEALYISQPAVSKQITMLESELQVPLFIRKNHKLEITKEGKTFERFFQDYNRRFQALLQETRRNTQETTAVYNIGCLEGLDLSYIYDSLREHVHKKYPKVTLGLKGFSAEQIEYALRWGSVDGAIAYSALFRNKPGFHVVDILQVESILVFSDSHPLASRQDVQLSDFAEYPFYIGVGYDSKLKEGMTAAIMGVCNQAGFTPRIEHAAGLSDVYLQLRISNGVLLSSELILARNSSRFRTFDLGMKWTMAFVSLQEQRTEYAETVQNEIIDFFIAE